MNELQTDVPVSACEEPQEDALTPEEARDAQAFLIDEKLSHLFYIQFFALFLFVIPIYTVYRGGFIVEPATLSGLLIIILDMIVYCLLFMSMGFAIYVTAATIKCFRRRVVPDQNIKTAIAVSISCVVLAAHIAVFIMAVLQNAGIMGSV